MSYQPKKHPQNVPGKFYVTEDCLACESCQDAAPNNFRYGENGLSFVFKQPDTPEEVERCQQAVDRCPMEAIRNDGELATQL
jgi:ferredoxin